MSAGLIQYLALDIGAARIGVATANSIARIASPLTYISNNDQVNETIIGLLIEHEVDNLIIGKPQNMQGEDTQQTDYITIFMESLQDAIVARKDLRITYGYSDESNTSQMAEKQLRAKGKKYDKGDIDALAASFILQRYLDDPVNLKIDREFSNAPLGDEKN